MKRLLLSIRLLIEGLFGMICAFVIFLIPSTLKGTFPAILIIGFLGMPRRATAAEAARVDHFWLHVMLFSLFVEAILLVCSVLCLRDVFKVAGRLRTN